MAWARRPRVQTAGDDRKLSVTVGTTVAGAEGAITKARQHW